jgi:hypothetical protein
VSSDWSRRGEIGSAWPRVRPSSGKVFYRAGATRPALVADQPRVAQKQTIAARPITCSGARKRVSKWNVFRADRAPSASRVCLLWMRVEMLSCGRRAHGFVIVLDGHKEERQCVTH